MNIKTWMPLVMAVVLGLVALLMARKVLNRDSHPSLTKSNTVPVVMATRDVPLGRELTPEDLAVGEMPLSVVPARAFGRIPEVAGRVAILPLVKGQAVLETLLAPTGAGSGIQALIPPGMRAMTMNIDEVTGVAGMLVPGCHVDIMSIVQDDKQHQQVARTVLQNLKVTAVGRQISSTNAEGTPPPPANTITLLVTPKQATMLQLACSVSRPWLVLRSGRDGDEVKGNQTPVAELRGEDVASMPDSLVRPVSMQSTTQPSGADRPRSRSMQIIRGGVLSEMSFPLSSSEPGFRPIVQPDPEDSDTPSKPRTQPRMPAPPPAGVMTGTDQSPVNDGR